MPHVSARMIEAEELAGGQFTVTRCAGGGFFTTEVWIKGWARHLPRPLLHPPRYWPATDFFLPGPPSSTTMMGHAVPNLTTPSERLA